MMALDTHQIGLIQESFSKVAPIADTAAEIFYARLFEIAPEVQPLFKGDMSQQGAKLMATLGVVVEGLDDLASIVPTAEALAFRHLDYGVEAEHYESVGDALIFTLQKGLGPSFNAEVKRAWVAAYKVLSDVMIAAAHKSPAAS